VFKACSKRVGVEIVEVSFTYFSGFALSQAQKSIASLHEGAARMGYGNVLEVSTKSTDALGVALSAFNLKGGAFPFTYTVEKAFQAGKMFEHGGPYVDILEKESIKAKKDERLRNSGKLLQFKFFDREFGLNPPTFFYDWLYINTLICNRDLIGKLDGYDTFSDIAFNSEKSLNCQAYSIALFKSALYNKIDVKNLSSPDSFLATMLDEYNTRWNKRF
jgi:hypothetical protein